MPAFHLGNEWQQGAGNHRIAIIEDDPAVCDAMQRLLKIKGYRVSSYGSVEAYLDESGSKEFECLLLDMRLPGASGMQLLRQLSEQGGPPCIMVSGHGDIKLAVTALKLGAVDFLEKPVSNDALLSALHNAISNDSRWHARQRYAALSPREREIADCIVAGKTSRSIAAELVLSGRTVETHRAHILDKLGAANMAELVRTVVLARGT